jgi:ACS family hexuronate transporter-like MFS transporter
MVVEQASPSVSSHAGYFRWVICALLLFGTTKNYMDRNVLGVLNKTLQHDLGWNEIDFSNLVIAFQAAYALGMVVVGRLIDKLGTRLGYAIAMVFWSLASMGTALGSSFSSFAISRVALGFGEAAVFPASIKAVAEWYPKKERALATGIFNAGTSFGAMLTPVVVPWFNTRWGWRGAFIGIGALGFVWLVFWLLIYRKPEEHPRASRAELDYIRSDPQESAGKIKWLTLLPLRQTWAFVAGKFLIDPVWWFYLFWVPGFLQSKHGLALTRIGAPIVVIYLISDVGSVAAGWISSWLIRRGQRRSQDRDAALRCQRYARGVRIPRGEHLVRRTVDWTGRRVSSRIFSQLVHIDLRHVSSSCRGLGSGNRRYGRCDWRFVHRNCRGPRAPMDGKLPSSFPHCRFGLLAGTRHYSCSGP